jgi:predicted metal-dependent phosphoesterase TrpH
VLKVELHCHTDQDPLDAVPHSTRELIDYAARLGYHALSVTLHDAFFDPRHDLLYARDKGITLIPGIERSIKGKHVLLINFPAASERVRSFDDIAQLKRDYPEGIVIAPHGWYPIPTALGGRLIEEHAALFDAVEVNALYTPTVDFNTAAIRWARAHGKPLVGNSDLHILEQLGRTYTLVDAEPSANAICRAIREGRVDVRTEPISLVRAAWQFSRMSLIGAIGRARRLHRS